MSTICEICKLECKEEDLQKHLIEEHNMLFCQYIGLLSKKIDIISNLDIKIKNKKKK